MGAGNTETDTGNAEVDTGNAEADTGNAEVDTGIAETGTGNAEADTGNAETDPKDAAATEGEALRRTKDAGGLAASFSIHSYGSLWLYAYGYTSALPPDHLEMERVSAAGVAGIAAVNGSVYTAGPHYTTIYPSTGTVVDYGYEYVRATHTYIIEARSDGYGFLLPEDLIAGTAEEIWQGVLAAVLAL
ncbi:carboxypeptidase A1 [Hyalella azteca]|uniref:Carboxypeptidase A1 n=1 Tax=Hyalella azteca TaxID=294128 RepID=A0A8B7NLK0_HYAAZ|nr:carboxypeptidase A1 [Hyalella azteca]